ncbi:DUF883 C-terminal domain-containing protein [Rheinheimera muenzenbergensis]|uniref:DUF883 C-terminal domain-containing protein n=1 Tax=Rheinheimera muenzenbergensis TaxID=1193628 RepID=A0ABU8C2M7_9GAMM|nr:DUF883 C-terminal domain-containing protein [Gammaproteobacteria bacterium]MBU1556420.1 DUF883 C-terminal domain-containing protein [Gammaproteobacteria bacterium]MBU2071996.1 DUF883 C-terminal domain-containing protein [Gammaproteobacteria bacterium]MBU2183919.1 DUF883 C-terminal domain-containing protein [Gammaproteobacteria bacterium]MBU2203327.1 DUF883 C-terminal domain-containing protein [Gammaproteobacteria bacterium]
MASSSTQAGSSANGAANSPVTNKASQAAHHAVDAMAEKAAAAEDSLRKTAATSRDNIAQKQEHIKQQLQSSYSKTRQLAEQNPLATAGIAFAAGVLLTSLLRRR